MVKNLLSNEGGDCTNVCERRQRRESSRQRTPLLCRGVTNLTLDCGDPGDWCEAMFHLMYIWQQDLLALV